MIVGRPRKSEMVNHPSHYNLEGRKECIVELEEKFGVKNVMIWCYMTAEKYLYRAGSKEGSSEEEDIAKAIWYVEYVDKLAEKWKTDAFDPRMKQQIEKSITEAKRRFRQERRAEEEAKLSENNS